VVVEPVIPVQEVGIQELLVKDLEVVPPEVVLHMPVAEVAALAVQVELDKAAMLVKADKVDK
jgi:hypothetical protein